MLGNGMTSTLDGVLTRYNNNTIICNAMLPRRHPVTPNAFNAYEHELPSPLSKRQSLRPEQKPNTFTLS